MSRSTDENGLWVSNGVPTFGVNQGGRLVIYARADTMADLDAALLSEGLRQEVTRDDGSVAAVPLPHIEIDVFQFEIAPAPKDAEGNIIGQATIDPRPHCNIKIDLRWRDADKSFNTLRKWMGNGRGLEASEQNRNENGKKLGGITLLDPTTFTPMRVFA